MCACRALARIGSGTISSVDVCEIRFGLRREFDSGWCLDGERADSPHYLLVSMMVTELVSQFAVYRV